MPMGLKRVVVMKGLKGLESDYVICAMKKYFEAFDSSVLRKAHLSKCKSDLKQKCTQLLTSVSGKVFHGILHGAIHFAWSVSFENQLNRSF